MKPGSYLTEVEDMQSHLTGQPKLPDVARSYGSYDPPASEFASVLGVRPKLLCLECEHRG